jgi:anthranilate phosphoribosyltransferase
VACNAQIIRDVLRGSAGPKRDVVLANAAAGLLAAGIVGDLRSGMECAARSIDSGAAWGKLQMLKEKRPAV